jgi:hypothetical protein
MSALYKEALNILVESFDELSDQLGKPEEVAINGGYTYRYKDENIYVAMVLKLARVITGLQAIYYLNQKGFIQESAALQRIADELGEDILFLSFSIIFDDETERHKTYLDAFFEEENEEGKSLLESAQKRPMVLRKHIQAYINKNRGAGDDQNTGKEANRTLSKAYSGYVHSAAPHVMELFYGNPPIFHLSGAQASPLYEDHINDMLNYFYRGLLSMSFAAKAFENELLFQKLFEYSKSFEKKSGRESDLTPYAT